MSWRYSSITLSFVNHFLLDGWFRDLLCFSWNHRTLSGLEKIHKFLSHVVDGKSRLEYSSLRDFKVDDHTISAPSPFKLPGSQGIEGVQGAFTFSITNPAALERGFFRLVQDADKKWKALTLFTNMQDLVGHKESPPNQHSSYEDREITWEEDVDAKWCAIEVDPTVLIVGGGQSGLMCAARLRMLGIRALIIEKDARVGDCWRQRYAQTTYIPQGKLADFLESYAVNQELCVWLSSTITSIPIYESLSARWTVEVQHGDQKVILNPKHLILATGSGSPHIPTWSGMDEFQGALYHSNFHKDAEQFRGKRVIVVSVGNASGDICQDFVAHGAAEVTLVKRSATCVVSSAAMEKTRFRSLYPNSTPMEELDFRSNSMPLAFLLQLTKSDGIRHMKMLDQELHDGLRQAGFNLTWEVSPGSGEVGLEGFLYSRFGSGTSAFRLVSETGDIAINTQCLTLAVVKQGQDISHFDKDGITFKDGSELSADVIVLATGNEPIMKTARALLGKEITDQLLPPEVWGLDSEGELNQAYRPSGHPGLWFAVGPFGAARFFSKHLGLQILARELGIA
ncbi:FAD/NAD(P)-binding domain-containing protein [Suillus hirtellus]|nr:FAD/NAD(P)-binding domain-containing protein [Suillus hirtellus]